MSDFLITVIIFCVVVGLFILSLAIDFIDVGDSQIESSIDWPNALLGAALLLIAGVLAAVRWPL